LPSLDLLIPFALATAAFAYMPGPALLYAAAQTLSRGRHAGLMAALGIHVGGYAHVIGPAVGLSAIFRYVPEAYLAVKLGGALYLIWLGIQLIVAKPASTAPPGLARRSARQAFCQSIAVEVLNPKATLFFIAFLPQFVDPGATLPVGVQLLVLGTVVNLAFSSADLVVVVVAGKVATAARRSDLGPRIARCVGGAILTALGARLALADD
jgi:threonine/homoserine/homoserine lactone efflux protein